MEAFLSCDPGYMILWPLQEVPELNAGYGIPEFAPDFLCFGSSGGGELLAFDEAGAVHSLAAIGFDAMRSADSWDDFARCIERPV